MFVGEGDQAEIVWESINISDENMEGIVNQSNQVTHQQKTAKKIKKFERSARHAQVKYLTRSRIRVPEKSSKNKSILDCPNNCGSSFYQKFSLDKHLKFVCGQPLRYKCPYCDMTSRIQHCVTTHVKARHPDLKTYVIDLTPLKSEPHFEEDFTSPIIHKVEPIWNEEQEIKILNVSSLASLDIKHEYDTFKQEVDDNSFDNSLTKTPKKFVCPNNCGNSYKYEHTLKVHLQFACNRSDHPNNFHLDDDESDSEAEDMKLNPDELLNPMATGDVTNAEPSPDGKWNCSNKCGATFNSRKSLSTHLKIHCGVTPKLECPYCLHRSRHSWNGFTHIRNKHPGAEVCLVHVDTGEVLKKKYTGPTTIMNLRNASPVTYNTTERKSSGKASMKCQHCAKVFKSQSTLARHLYEGCGFPPRFKCPYCDYQVRRLSYAFFHVSKNHPGCEVYMVDLVTGDSITDPAQIKKEAIADIAEDQKPFLSPPELPPQKTVKTHPAGLQKKRLPCPTGCGRSFFFRVSLEKHIKICERNVSQLSTPCKCPYCDNRYEHRSSLFRHIKASHHGQKMYAIDIEEEIVPESASSPLIPKTETIKTKRLSKEKDKKTEVSVDNKVSLKLHVCPNKCGSSFDQYSNLVRHIRLNCPKARRYKCPKCNHRSQKFGLIVKHIKASHKMTRIYAVDYYTKREIFNELRHRPPKRKTEDEPADVKPTIKKIASPELPKNKIRKRVFCSNNCGRSFNNEDSLAYHLKHICGKVRYKCPYCSQFCRHQGNMTLHIMHRHPGKKNYVIDMAKKKPQEVGKELKLVVRKLEPEKATEEKKEVKETRERKLEKMREEKKIEEKMQEKIEEKMKLKREEKMQKKIQEKMEKKEERKQKEIQAAIFGNPLKRKQVKLFNYRKRRIICPHKCGKFFPTGVKLKLHMETVCKTPVSTKCPYCSQVCKFLWNLDKHIKKYHPEQLRKNVPGNVKNNEEDQEEEVELKLTGSIEDEPGSQDVTPDCSLNTEPYEDVEMKSAENPEDTESENPVDQVTNPVADQVANPVSSQVGNQVGNQIEDQVTNQVSNPFANQTTNDFPNEANTESEFEKYSSDVSQNSNSSGSKISIKKFPCPNNCGKSYPKESSLKNHLMYICNKPLRYKCPYCDNRMKVSCNGYVHVKRMHPTEKVYLIDLESDKATRRSKYQPPDATSETDLTGKISGDLVDMNDSNVDMDVDEPDEPDEPILGTEEEFANDPVVREQSLAEKEECFVCPNNCGSSFTNEHKLTNHVRDQCGPPRYKCPYCFFITREPSSVYAHIKNKHPEERIYLIDTDMNQSCNEPDSPTGNEDN